MNINTNNNFNNYSNVAVGMEKFIMQILLKNKLLNVNKLFGIVEKKITDSLLQVYLEQEQRSVDVKCPPRIPFEVGDRVLVENINNNPQDRFVVAIIEGVSKDTEIIDYASLPSEPVQLVYDETTNKLSKAIYGYDNPRTLWEQRLLYDESGKLISDTRVYPDGMVIRRFLIRDDKGKLIKYE